MQCLDEGLNDPNHSHFVMPLGAVGWGSFGDEFVQQVVKGFDLGLIGGVVQIGVAPVRIFPKGGLRGFEAIAGSLNGLSKGGLSKDIKII